MSSAAVTDRVGFKIGPVDRLERLVNLVVALLDTRRPLAREELRQRVGGYSGDDENFRRTFERDKEELRQLGIPIVVEPLDRAAPELGSGYRVPRDLYELPDPGLDDAELMALSLAASEVALGGMETAAITAALRKLAASAVGGAANGTALAEAPGVDMAPMVDMTLDGAVAALFAAVAERRSVSFTYSDVERLVDPYRLSYREGRWYLSGFDHSRGAERLFRADRVSGPVTIVGPRNGFERPGNVPAGPPPPWRLGDDDEVLVDLRVAPGQATWFRDMAGEDALVSVAEDGWSRFRLPVTNLSAFRSFVLGLLDHAEVLGPPEVRQEVVAWLAALAAPAPAPAPLPPAGHEGPGADAPVAS